jgi:hypothetical protein
VGNLPFAGTLAVTAAGWMIVVAVDRRTTRRPSSVRSRMPIRWDSCWAAWS